MRKLKSTNPQLVELVQDLKVESYKNDVKIWKDLAKRLSKPSRIISEVNVSKLNRYTEENHVVVVPGKVLGSGKLAHKITVAAFSFSEGAKKAVEEAGGRCITIKELINENPKGSLVKIMA
jgi:large subunit ribosomal protein L18e